jgi:uncharacterized protein YerC
LLAVVQPGESTGTFSDALTRMSGEATYLYVNSSQYWYNLRANVTRLANDRANSNFSIHDADAEVRRRLQAERGTGLFSALHVFPDGPGDVIDDDDGVHLIVLSVEHPHVANVTDSKAIKIAEQILTQRNAGPRMNQNLLVFVAANEARLNDVRSAARQYLAWKSILEDKETLQLIPNDTNLAMTKIGETQRTLQQRVDDAYQMVMVPSKKPGDATIEWHITRPSGAGSLADRVGNKLEAEEKLISRYSGTRVRMDLDRIPLWSANRDVKIADLWDAYCRFPYLPRLASFEVLQHAVRDGIAKTDWITDGFAYAEAREGDDFRGLIAAAIPNTARSGLLVHPEIAEPLLKPAPVPVPEPAGGSGSPGPQPPPQPPPSGQPKVRFYATFTLDGVRGVAQLSDILNDVVDHLKREPGSGVEITLEVRAQNEAGFSAQTIRVVNENSRARGSLNPEFES